MSKCKSCDNTKHILDFGDTTKNIGVSVKHCTDCPVSTDYICDVGKPDAGTAAVGWEVEFRKLYHKWHGRFDTAYPSHEEKFIAFIRKVRAQAASEAAERMRKAVEESSCQQRITKCSCRSHDDQFDILDAVIAAEEEIKKEYGQ